MDRKRFAALGLLVLTAALYAQVAGFPFVNYDDTPFIVYNAHVRQGLTWPSVHWAFTAAYEGNYQPLVWLSFMLDYEVGGLYPGVYHLTNLALHLANTLLLLIVLVRMTQAYWKSLAVAALFALHPLHVESVAWVAERKDVLSTFFLLLTLWAYVGYVQKPSVGRYLPVVLAFGLGLLAKPMLVTLPVLLVLLDYWPLGRRLRLAEKIPLVALSVVFSAIAFIAQRQAGALHSFDAYPLSVRLGNAAISCVSYIGKMVWPLDLAVFYPYPKDGLPLGQLATSIVFLVCIFALVIRFGRRYPYLLVGWLWYLVSLLPVIGLVQIGRQAMADRYTYIPLIGLFVLLVWGLADLAQRKGPSPASPARRTRVLAATGSVALVFLCACTWFQIGYWRGNYSLFSHALDVTINNAVAELGMAQACGDQRDYDASYRHHLNAIEIDPGYADAYTSLGVLLAATGHVDEAIANYRKALEINPDHAPAHSDLGLALLGRGHVDEAAAEFRHALRIRPMHPDYPLYLAYACFNRGDYVEAWRMVHRCRRSGGHPKPDFIEKLSQKMPEPKE